MGQKNTATALQKKRSRTAGKQNTFLHTKWKNEEARKKIIQLVVDGFLCILVLIYGENDFGHCRNKM